MESQEGDKLPELNKEDHEQAPTPAPKLDTATKSHNQTKRNSWLKDTMVGVGVLAAMWAAIEANDANEKSDRALRESEMTTHRADYYNSLSTRIDTCMSIAAHHYQWAIGEKETDAPWVNYNGERVRITLNLDRGNSSIRMGRELVLCSINAPDFEAVKTCVDSATNDQENKRVLDEIKKGVGRMNPAC